MGHSVYSVSVLEFLGERLQFVLNTVPVVCFQAIRDHSAREANEAWCVRVLFRATTPPAARVTHPRCVPVRHSLKR